MLAWLVLNSWPQGIHLPWPPKVLVWASCAWPVLSSLFFYCWVLKILFLFWDRVLRCCPGCSVVAQSQLTAASASWIQVILLPQPPEYLGLQVHATTPANSFFIILVETGFHHVDQAGLELLISGYPPSLASQSAWITGVSHCTQPRNFSTN